MIILYFYHDQCLKEMVLTT